MDKFISQLGEEVQDPDEEVFLIFSEPIPSSNLGFISSTSSTITVSVGNDEYEVHQSPGLLSSNASSGTTGAVLWKITPVVADWLLGSNNVLFESDILGPDSHVVELGCGISGLIALTLRKRVGKYVATDLDYVLRGLKKNLEEHGSIAPAQSRKSGSAASRGRQIKPPRGSKGTASSKKVGEVLTLDLDWTTCTSHYLRESLPDDAAIDCILACDCIYNEALVEPFVQTCKAICQLRDQPTVCIVAQQLRSDVVFEAWLKDFIKVFHVYRLSDALLSPELSSGSGYVVHVGIVRDAKV